MILAAIKTPKTDKSLAEDLKVQIGQIRAWLKIAVGEGKVIKPPMDENCKCEQRSVNRETKVREQHPERLELS